MKARFGLTCSLLASAGFAVGMSVLGCASDSGDSESDARTSSDDLLGWTNVAFEQREIPVCWEQAGWTAEKEAVRIAVRDTWELADLVHFVGWGECTPSSTGIRIEIAAKRAFANALGKNLLGKPNGITLNFTFGPEYAPECASNPEAHPTMRDYARWSCIHIDAVHEFGHALGFAHEQNRPDRPEWASCGYSQLVAGLETDLPVPDSTFGTSYDSRSVMNYCNWRYWSRGYDPYVGDFGVGWPWRLSQGDIDGMRAMYARFGTGATFAPFAASGSLVAHTDEPHDLAIPPGWYDVGLDYVDGSDPALEIAFDTPDVAWKDGRRVAASGMRCWGRCKFLVTASTTLRLRLRNTTADSKNFALRVYRDPS